MQNLLDLNEYNADVAARNIVKTYTESTIMIFKSYPEALRLLLSFAEVTVVQRLNDTLVAIEEAVTVNIPVSSEGAINALATGPTAEATQTAVQLRFYKNQFDIDEDVIENPNANARVQLYMLAIVFAVNLQSTLEIFRALRSAPHSLDAIAKRNYYRNMILQIGAGMLRDDSEKDDVSRMLALRALLVTAARDFSNVPRDQLFGIVVDSKTAGSIGITSPIENSNDLLKIANPSLFKATTPMSVGGVVVETIAPFFESQIQNGTRLTMDYTTHMSFANFVAVKSNASFVGNPIRIHIPSYNGGAFNFVVPAAGAGGHNNQDLLVVIRDAAIRGPSHIVVFGKDKPIALAESAATRVRGGLKGDIDARTGMGYVSASRFVGATCIRPHNVVEFMARIVSSIDLKEGATTGAATSTMPGDVKIANWSDSLDGDGHNIFVLRLSSIMMPTKDVFDLEKSGLFAANHADSYWNGTTLELNEQEPLGYALSMPVAASVEGATTVAVTGPASLSTNALLNFSPCHGPGLTLAAGVDAQYQGTSTVTVPTISELTELYASSYQLTTV